MNEQTLEEKIRQSAATFPYPPTPNVTHAVRRRLDGRSQRSAPVRPRLAWAAALVLLLVAGLLAVPRVRAALFEIIRAGAITIFVGEPTPTAVPGTPISGDKAAVPLTATPPFATTVSEFAGLTTLAEADTAASFPLRGPSNYGPPDEVYLQKITDPGFDGEVVIMVWRDPMQPGQASLRLFQISLPTYGLKQASIESIVQTEVNGQTAFWIEEEHRLQLPEGQSYYVSDSVLVWVEDEITYRLESRLTLEEAVQIAASLEPIQENRNE